MPQCVDYAHVLHTADSAGLRCGYPNGGAFLLNLDPAHVAGWSAAAEPGVPPAPPGWTGSNVDFFDPAGTTAATMGLSTAVAGNDAMIAVGTTYGGSADQGAEAL